MSTYGSSGQRSMLTTSTSRLFCARWKLAIAELGLAAIRYCLDGRFYVMDGRGAGFTDAGTWVPDQQAV